MTTHPYAEDRDGGPDHTGAYPCTCGLPKGNRNHRLPDRTADDRALEARKMGEK